MQKEAPEGTVRHLRQFVAREVDNGWICSCVTTYFGANDVMVGQRNDEVVAGTDSQVPNLCREFLKTEG